MLVEGCSAVNIALNSFSRSSKSFIGIWCPVSTKGEETSVGIATETGIICKAPPTNTAKLMVSLNTGKNCIDITHVHNGPSTVWRYASTSIRAGSFGSSRLVGPLAICLSC